MFDKKAFGERVYKARAAQGLTLKGVADKMGAPVSLVFYYENGLRTPFCERLCDLCNALDVSADWLLGRG